MDTRAPTQFECEAIASSTFCSAHSGTTDLRLNALSAWSRRCRTITPSECGPRRSERSAAPRELQELAARIERLRERLQHGDPDMTTEELHAAIDRAEEKRRELQGLQDGAGSPAKALAILPRAAELYRRQVALGIDGHPEAILKARLFLQEWFGGKIRLEPLPGGGLMAHWNQSVGALLKGLGSCGGGGRIWNVPIAPQSVRVK